MNRRGFFRGLLGLIGLGAASKNTESELKSKELGTYDQNRMYLLVQHKELRAKCRVRIEKSLDRLVTNWRLLDRPTPIGKWEESIDHLIDQMIMTGMGLAWMVPDASGSIKEFWVVATTEAIPHPATKEYPCGYYVMRPAFLWWGSLEASGAIIPAERMFRVQCPAFAPRYDVYSPLTALRLHVEEQSEIDRIRHKIMSCCASPGRLLTLPPGLQTRSM